MGGFTNIPKLKIEDLGTENAGDRIALFNSVGELVGYQMAGSGGAFLPLSGGTMTGDIVLKDVDSNPFIKIGFDIDTDETGIFYDNGVDQKTRLAFFNGLIQAYVTSGSYYTFGNNGLVISSNGNSDLKGVIGEELFNKQNDPNAFAQLGDMSSISETIEEISRASLNSTYEDRPNGFQLICPNINLIYIKNGILWHKIVMTIVL